MNKAPSINQLKQARKFFKRIIRKAIRDYPINFTEYKHAVINTQIARLEDLRNEGRLFVEKYVKIKTGKYIDYVKTLFLVKPEVSREEIKNET